MAQQLDDKRPVFDHSATPNVGRMPAWIRQRLGGEDHYGQTADAVRRNALNTVCEEARCPNRAECWSRGTATFMLLGDTCTRACGYCAVKTGKRVVWGHNVETVPRRYKTVRKGADYSRSLQLLAQAAQLADVEAKSALMLGLGETRDEVLAVMRDLSAAGVQRVSLGQYLRPSRYHLAVQEYVTPAQFDEYAAAARAMGFEWVKAGALVRSSYHAEEEQ